MSSIDFSLLRDRNGFPSRVMEALAREPVDYPAQFEFINRQWKSRERWGAGGILLPLFFREEQARGRGASGCYVFLLNKRSKHVQQPGDPFRINRG